MAPSKQHTTETTFEKLRFSSHSSSSHLSSVVSQMTAHFPVLRNIVVVRMRNNCVDKQKARALFLECHSLFFSVSLLLLVFCIQAASHLLDRTNICDRLCLCCGFCAHSCLTHCSRCACLRFISGIRSKVSHLPILSTRWVNTNPWICIKISKNSHRINILYESSQYLEELTREMNVHTESKIKLFHLRTQFPLNCHRERSENSSTHSATEWTMTYTEIAHGISIGKHREHFLVLEVTHWLIPWTERSTRISQNNHLFEVFCC